MGCLLLCSEWLRSSKWGTTEAVAGGWEPRDDGVAPAGEVKIVELQVGQNWRRIQYQIADIELYIITLSSSSAPCISRLCLVRMSWREQMKRKTLGLEKEPTISLSLFKLPIRAKFLQRKVRKRGVILNGLELSLPFRLADFFSVSIFSTEAGNHTFSSITLNWGWVKLLRTGSWTSHEHSLTPIGMFSTLHNWQMGSVFEKRYSLLWKSTRQGCRSIHYQSLSHRQPELKSL